MMLLTLLPSAVAVAILLSTFRLEKGSKAKKPGIVLLPPPHPLPVEAAPRVDRAA